jgi:ubiquinone/menaquinone biosynthesis C-methylase UbiE
VERFNEDANSLFVRAYDAFYVGGALELACGTGRIALALANIGLEVTGVDISEGMLSVARRKMAVL